MWEKNPPNIFGSFHISTVYKEASINRRNTVHHPPFNYKVNMSRDYVDVLNLDET